MLHKFLYRPDPGEDTLVRLCALNGLRALSVSPSFFEKDLRRAPNRGQSARREQRAYAAPRLDRDPRTDRGRRTVRVRDGIRIPYRRKDPFCENKIRRPRKTGRVVYGGRENRKDRRRARRPVPRARRRGPKEPKRTFGLFGFLRRVQYTTKRRGKDTPPPPDRFFDRPPPHARGENRPRFSHTQTRIRF